MSQVPSNYQIQNVQNFIKELEISEGQLSSCIKAIYENKQKDEFLKSVEDKIKHYDTEIEALCNKNYQGFVDSFYELLNLRTQTNNLKQNLSDNNTQIQQIGQTLVGKVEELVRETKKQNNIIQTIDALGKCQPVFDIYRKLNDNMQQKKYYPALKLLEELENNHLPSIKKYRFSLSIQNSIPKFKDEIKEESLKDLKSFLETLKNESELVGKIASSQMAKKNKIDKSYYLLDNEISTIDKSDSSNSDLNDKISNDLTQKIPFDVVDFSPLYRNLHMNQILGSKSSFAEYYRKQRKKQLKLILQPQTNMFESLDGYKRHFHGVAGFFVIEDQIMSSTEGLVDERFLDELANLAIPKLIEIIRKAMSQCKDVDLMLKVKIVVVLFCDTIDEVQFPTTQLSDLLKEIREMYYEMLLDKWNTKIRGILNEDRHVSVEASNEEQYKKLFKQFPCSVDSFYNETSLRYPRNMFYTPCVPKIFNEIRVFIENCAKFAEGLNSSQTELDDMVRKPTNKLITDRLKENLSNLISNTNENDLSKLVKILINTLFMEKSIDLLESHLLHVINATTSKQSGKLQGISVFKDLRSDSERRIDDLLIDKINDLMDFEKFNWNMSDMNGHASEYVRSLLEFLRARLEEFNSLPSKLAQTTCISACKHVAQCLMSAMLKPEIKSISYGTFEQLNLDLMQCESFASSLKINGLDNETIQLCFVDVRQIVDLILSKEWSLYIKDHGQANNKYNRVFASNALTLLEKLKEGSKKGKSFLSNLGIGSKQAEKDDKTLMEAALKQLRVIVAQTQLN